MKKPETTIEAFKALAAACRVFLDALIEAWRIEKMADELEKLIKRGRQ
jgi:hypothetical protein